MAKLRFQTKSTGWTRVKHFLKSPKFTYSIVIIQAIVIIIGLVYNAQ